MKCTCIFYELYSFKHNSGHSQLTSSLFNRLAPIPWISSFKTCRWPYLAAAWTAVRPVYIQTLDNIIQNHYTALQLLSHIWHMNTDIHKASVMLYDSWNPQPHLAPFLHTAAKRPHHQTDNGKMPFLWCMWQGTPINLHTQNPDITDSIYRECVLLMIGNIIVQVTVATATLVWLARPSQ